MGLTGLEILSICRKPTVKNGFPTRLAFAWPWQMVRHLWITVLMFRKRQRRPFLLLLPAYPPGKMGTGGNLLKWVTKRNYSAMTSVLTIQL